MRSRRSCLLMGDDDNIYIYIYISQVNDVLNNTGQTLQRFERKHILPLSQRG